MREPLAVISKYIVTGGDLLDPPPLVRAAMRHVQREDDADASHWSDWKAEDIERFIDLVDQQRLEFAEEDAHANVRMAVARYLETVVNPVAGDPKLWEAPATLRAARTRGTIMFNRTSGKFITIWDEKAGMPLLCPDDAREEAMRVQRRVVPAVMEALKQPGARAYSCVFTIENAPLGQLRKQMRSLQKRFNAFMRKMKRDQSLPILGAYSIMEAPLGGYRDWHPHLNVILVTSGWFDYAVLRDLWARNVQVQRIEPDWRDKTMEEALGASLRELIKYPVRAMSEKSNEKSSTDELIVGRDGTLRPPAPSMLEWTAEEFLEWWYAHKRFRRSRGYGCLYKLKKPEPESLDAFEAVGTATREGTRLVRRFTLLESIPGDKSTTPDHRERLKAHLRKVLGDPNRHRQAIELMQRAMQSWQ